jgi:hypothetical protein
MATKLEGAGAECERFTRAPLHGVMQWASASRSALQALVIQTSETEMQ